MMWKKRVFNGVIFFILLFVEVLIALFVHDHFVRPYIGDALVVIVLYFFVRIFVPAGCPFLPLAIFAFASLVEALQYFRLVELLGVQDNVFLRVLIGSTFDWKDILCYGAGCVLLAVGEHLNGRLS